MGFSQSIKSRKFLTIIIVASIVLFGIFFLNSLSKSIRMKSGYEYKTEALRTNGLNYGMGVVTDMAAPSMGVGGGYNDYYPNPISSSESVNINPTIPRKVLLETYLSLMVKNVSESLKDVKDKTESLGGFVVSSSYNSPMESSSATLVIRVPSENAAEMAEYLKGNAIKVVSESQTGQDITDQYQDIEERIRVINETKIRFEEIFDNAKTVEEMLMAQREILNQQTQLDYLTGQKKYMEDAAKSVEITAYFSEDEYSLPYSPNDGFNLKTIFKQAVRSLMLTLRSFAEFVIWILVYAVVWIPILLILIIIYKLISNHLRKKETQKKESKDIDSNNHLASQ